MERYDPTCRLWDNSTVAGEMKEDPQGDYIRFEDHQEELIEVIREKDTEIANLESRIEELEDELQSTNLHHLGF